MTFIEKLNRAWTDNQSMLMVGLDPDPARLPLELASKPGAIYEFCKAIVDVTADYQLGAAGSSALVAQAVLSATAVSAASAAVISAEAAPRATGKAS